VTAPRAVRRDPASVVGYWATTGWDEPAPALRGAARADVAIVGGGFTGLWAAIHLADADPSLRIVVLEMETVGFGASGRNGGFCSYSLTHGLANGISHYPDEIEVLEREGLANLADLVAFVRSEGIDCELEETGTIDLADRPGQVEEFRSFIDEAAAFGHRLELLEGDRLQSAVRSPLWLAGLRDGPERTVLVNPAKLAWGLKAAASRRGVVIHERTRVTGLVRRAGGVRVRTSGGGTVDAANVIVATSAYSAWLRRLGRLFVPVYDYALVSEPLSPEQREAIGWRGREGLGDANNRFHYFRQTADDRILWGGFDAIYYPGSDVGPRYDRRPATFEVLEANFRRAFPALAELRFPYRWGGAIDTTSRFTVTFGSTMGDRVHYALGYTGLGVGAARWAGLVLRDRIIDPDAERLDLRFVRSSPFPFPPEPLRTLAVSAVQHELARADERDGRRGLLLRTLDALGMGFDS
jgi:glycine/D-amino acid oxidase-like deaminating enzyme